MQITKNYSHLYLFASLTLIILAEYFNMKNDSSYRIGEMVGSCLFFVGVTAIILKITNKATKKRIKDYTIISIGVFVFSCVNFSEVISERNQLKPVIDNILHNLYLSRNVPVKTDNEISNLLNEHIELQKQLFQNYYGKIDEIGDALSPEMLTSKQHRAKNLLLIEGLEQQINNLYDSFYKKNQNIKEELVARNADNELIDGIKRGEDNGRTLFNDFINNQKQALASIKEIILFCDAVNPIASEENILFNNNNDLEKYNQLLQKILDLAQEEEKIMIKMQDSQIKSLEKLKNSL